MSEPSNDAAEATQDELAAPEMLDAVPLLHPADGMPPLSVTADEIADAAATLARGTGPFAVDAERASGFRYSNRAYLIQIRRAGAGTVLIDPVNHGGSPIDVLEPVAQVLATDEWILHAADQDLPCLAEVGMWPPALYDTELAGRLAGFDRVNLAAMTQRLLGVALAKGHGAADWSKRPLPEAWLNYAALDVEILIELRLEIAAVLADQNKTDWAAEEFEHLRRSDPTPTRRDRWRRTSGIHKIRDARRLAAVRELWTVRDTIARRRDIAPGRILPDAAIIAAATADPRTIDELTALAIFGGSRQRRSAQVWLTALETARANPEPPDITESISGPPPAVRWSKRKPEAAARLEAARAALTELSTAVAVPTENILSPELVRRLCWDWQLEDSEIDVTGNGDDRRQPTSHDIASTIDQFLRSGGARQWQRNIAVPALTKALAAQPN